MSGWVFADSVLALTVYNGELIAGGDFTTAGDCVSVCWARWGCPYVKGDLNCDGAINGLDIDPFVLVLLTTPPYDAYYSVFPGCDHMLGDINADGAIDGFDIDPLVALMLGGG